MQKIQDLIREALALQKNRIFLWVPFFLSIGIAVYFSLRTEPLWGATLLMVLISGCALAWAAWRDINRGQIAVLTIIVAATFLSVLGFSLAQVRANWVYTPMITKKMEPVGVVGTIRDIVVLEAGEGSRVILSDVEIEKLNTDSTPRHVRLKIRKDQTIQVGQRISVLAGINPPSRPVAPGAFDFQRMAYFKGIGAVGFAYNEPEILDDVTKENNFWENLRHALSRKISNHTEDPNRAVLIALMTGERGAISDEDWKALREAGLAHMLAISGLHVGMVAGVLFFFSRLIMAAFPPFALRHPIKKYAALIALLGACLYTVLVGATIPTQRALIMTGLAMVAIMLDRSPFSLRLVALAALLVLIFAPESLTSVSFQMSFAAVTALICFYEATRALWMAAYREGGMLRKFSLYFLGVMSTTVIASIATGLFSLYHFQNFALYGVLANLVAVPILTFIVMPFAVLSYLLMPLGIEFLTLPISEWGVEWILNAAHWVSEMEGAVLHAPVWQHWVFVLMAVVSWFFCVWNGRGRWLAIPVFIVLVLFAVTHKQPDLQISERVDLVSVRDHHEKLWLSTGRTERYTARNWLRRNGQVEEDKIIWPKEKQDKGFPLLCDTLGCRGEIKGHKVSIAFAKQAAREDCLWADVIISKEPYDVRECDSSIVIDFFDVWRLGGHALWITSAGVRVKSVEEERGNRLWTNSQARNH